MEDYSPKSQWRVFIAGSAAGFAVDTSLYPIDTIKARLQSKQGFIKAGGFSRLYRGLSPVLVGSIPNSAVFFVTYEYVKDELSRTKLLGNRPMLEQIVGACLGETASCMVRIPYEVIKMRHQTSTQTKVSNIAVVRSIISVEGLPGFYRGFTSTVLRDCPFSAIQYPLWEQFKKWHHQRKGIPVNAVESAFYGAIAGGIGAFVTNPLDVARTRIVLADKSELPSRLQLFKFVKSIYLHEGVKGLMAGVGPRVFWISAGAAIFLGAYDKTSMLLEEYN